MSILIFQFLKFLIELFDNNKYFLHVIDCNMNDYLLVKIKFNVRNSVFVGRGFYGWKSFRWKPAKFELIHTSDWFQKLEIGIQSQIFIHIWDFFRISDALSTIVSAVNSNLMLRPAREVFYQQCASKSNCIIDLHCDIRSSFQKIQRIRPSCTSMRNLPASKRRQKNYVSPLLTN